MSATVGQLADQDAGRQFAKELLAEFKQRNIDDGVNMAQALWMHHRMRAWACTYGGNTYTVDIPNMAMAGDIQTACVALLYGAADDMGQAYHWLSAERLLWLTSNMKAWLGWP